MDPFIQFILILLGIIAVSVLPLLLWPDPSPRRSGSRRGGRRSSSSSDTYYFDLGSSSHDSCDGGYSDGGICGGDD
jgi:uncharacterized membrane protein